ncbi:hypothetical protein [Colwellia sp. E2M01]|uniref:hypothetical protein n=1 Tax=Colwellia sp. E2M01 TaxID=2841561 RepID=UPI001C08C37B|nr:hypothetical protein [Colwellia sp. E2M01]MBU2872195.1 hypothetical protein [Colwellia sp. E2M01]
MKYILIIISLLVLSACGSGSDDKQGGSNTDTPGGSLDEQDNFTLQNIRFDGKDYFEGESVTITEGSSFEVQWVSPILAAYKIDLYLSTNGEEHSDSNKIVSLKCGSTSFSLCPNVTGEVECEVDDNRLFCSIANDNLGEESFLDEDKSNLTFIVKGCDGFNNCDVKTFNLMVENETDK